MKHSLSHLLGDIVMHMDLVERISVLKFGSLSRNAMVVVYVM
jgi:hypothetical protein